jgi:hypothetical protein
MKTENNRDNKLKIGSFRSIRLRNLWIDWLGEKKPTHHKLPASGIKRSDCTIDSLYFKIKGYNTMNNFLSICNFSKSGKFLKRKELPKVTHKEIDNMDTHIYVYVFIYIYIMNFILLTHSKCTYL